LPETWFSPSFQQSFSGKTAKTPAQEEFVGTALTCRAEYRSTDPENVHTSTIKKRVQKRKTMVLNPNPITLVLLGG
jgi:hypothetical protein